MLRLINAERKRILSNRLILVIMVLILIYAIFDSVMSLQKFRVFDQYGNTIISAMENIKESKKPEHNMLLDEQTIQSVVNRDDVSRYLYNSNLVKLIASNYNKKIEDLTEQNISDFYKQRTQNVKANLGGSAQVDDINKLVSKSAELKTPIRLGYAEGWKSLNNDMVDFSTAIIYIIPFAILFLFGKNPKVKMDELCTSAKYGKKRLVTARFLTAFSIGMGMYFGSTIIYSVMKLSVLGFQGGTLPIQGSILYLFSPYNITFIQQYLINVFVGAMAAMMLISLTILVTVLLKQFMPSALVTTLFLIIMTMLPNRNFYLNFYVRNFLPFNMINFDNYYIQPYIYNVFGNILPTYVVVCMVAIVISLMLTSFSFMSSIRVYKRPL